MPGDHYFDTKGNATGAYDVPATSYVVVINKAGKVVYGTRRKTESRRGDQRRSSCTGEREIEHLLCSGEIEARYA
jgi:hypothetical protein